MSEIDFLPNQRPKDDPKDKARDPGGNVEWSEPPQAEKDEGGPFSFFKGGVDGSRPRSKQEALEMIREYVSAKESAAKPTRTSESPAHSNGRKALDGLAQTDPERTKRPAEEPAEEKVTALNFTGQAKAGAKTENRRGAWLKNLFGSGKKEEKGAREIAVLATDLIKGEIITFFDWKKNVVILVFFLFLSALLLTGLYQALDLWENSKKQEIREYGEKFTDLSVNIRQAEKSVEEILLFRKKLELARELLNSHVYWSNLFDYLEQNTLSDVFYSGFSGDTAGNYVLAATAKDFNTIAEQIKIFKSDGSTKRVFTSGGSVNRSKDSPDSSVSFSLELSVDPTIFNRLVP